MTDRSTIVFPSFAGYRRGWIPGDVLAGLTVWAVLIPESLAYATIAGVSPVVGLYAAPAALILYAAFGSSKHLVTGPMSATAALSAGVVAEMATSGSSQYVALTTGVALATGIAAIVAGLLRLGFLASFISEPVLKGFIVGMALTIIIGQVPKLLGIDGGEGNFFEKAWDVAVSVGDTNGWTLLVGATSIALVVILKRVVPVAPGSLIVVLLSIAAVSLFDLADRGVDIVGTIEPGLPPLGLPDLAGSDYLTLTGGAVGVMLVGFAEGLGAAKTYASKHHYEIDPNRELLGLGAANLGSGLSSGMVVNGSLSKTAVNGSAGARSQLSGLVVAVLTIVTLLFLTGLFENLPEATLAGVVIAAVVELVDLRSLHHLWQVSSSELGRIYGAVSRPDFIASITAMVGVLVFDTLPGLLIGVGVAALLLIYRSSRPHVAVLGRLPDQRHWVDVDRHPEAVRTPTVLVVRPESGLSYANADNVRAAILDQIDDATRVVVLDLQVVPDIDVSASKMLVDLAGTLAGRTIDLRIAREIGQVRDVLDLLDDAHVIRRVYESVDEAAQP